MRFNSEVFGLSSWEQLEIARALSFLPYGWITVLETTDDGAVYARVIPPWDKKISAFLIDREWGMIVLTDNISTADSCYIQSCDTLAAAATYIRQVLGMPDDSYAEMPVDN